MEMVNIASCSNQELMTAIRKYEGIYNKSCLDYKSPFYKRKAWLAIANELHSDVTTVHTRYNNIRTSFSRYLKSIRYFRGGLDSSSSGIAIKPKYEFLRWLIVHIKHRKSKAVTYDDAMQGPSGRYKPWHTDKDCLYTRYVCRGITQVSYWPLTWVIVRYIQSVWAAGV